MPNISSYNYPIAVNLINNESFKIHAKGLVLAECLCIFLGY